jgi:hypothetical protein
MRKLQIAQCFENIQTTYDQPSITWAQECAEFSLNESDPTTGQLIVWLDGVAPEQIITEIDGLERKINQFLLAMQVMDNARMRKKDEPAIKFYAKDGQEFCISTISPQIVVDAIEKHERGEPYDYGLGCGFKSIAKGSMISSPVSLPSTLPQAALKLERLIGIFTSAESFSSGPYLVEHQLRNYLLIMEELIEEGTPKPIFYDDLKKVRNFIAHARCHSPETTNFIENNFPEAMVNKKYALFDRAQSSHINFIWTYRDIAYFWVKEKLENLSNPDNNI